MLPKRSSEEIFETRFPKSRTVARKAEEVLAGGVCHDSWRLSPYPVAFESASGAYKTAIDGHRVIDLWMGHGALILGHAPKRVVNVLQRAAGEATHLAGLQSLQVEWGEKICQLVPSAERVRFTASGTEATLLAMRVARAFTDRPRIIKIDGHFHGWHDEALCGYYNAQKFGIDELTAESVVIAPPDDASTVAELVERGDIAAIILEPGGGSSSTLPYDPKYLADLRSIADSYRCQLIFDEVITGFRVAPGGIQGMCGVIPDLTVLAKILCGGLPGGAVVGRSHIMSMFDSDSLSKNGSAVVHSGTFNGNPLSAVAGIETLEALEDGSVQRSAANIATQLASAVNAVAKDAGVDICLFTLSSIVHLVIGAAVGNVPAAPSAEAVVLQRQRVEAHQVLRRILLVEGVDMHPTHGWLSVAHDGEVLAELVKRFARAFKILRNVSDWPSELVWPCR